MRKKEIVKKLALSRETIARLSPADLRQVQGGAWSDNSICPSTNPTTAQPETWTQAC